MADKVKVTRTSPKELVRQLNATMFRDAYDEGLSLSAYLQKKHYDPDLTREGLDVFDAMMMAADFRTRTLEFHGVQASTYGEMTQTEWGRALAAEWMRREWKAAAKGINTTPRDPKFLRQERTLYTSGEGTPGSWLRPYADAADGRWSSSLTPAVPVAALVAFTTGINETVYRAYYLTNDTDNQRMVRVPEGGPIPTAKLTGGEEVVRLYKYGRGLEASYEELRRMRLDRLSLHIARMSIQSEVDKVAAVISTIINGDGNNNGATVHALTTLDSAATSNAMTLKAWLSFKMKFAPYTCKVVLARENDMLNLLLVDVGNSNNALAVFSAVSSLGGFRPLNENIDQTVGYGVTADVTDQYLLGIDSGAAIERIYEIGAEIEEIETFIRTQTKLITFTEVEGYAVFDQEAMNSVNMT